MFTNPQKLNQSRLIRQFQSLYRLGQISIARFIPCNKTSIYTNESYPSLLNSFFNSLSNFGAWNMTIHNKFNNSSQDFETCFHPEIN